MLTHIHIYGTWLSSWNHHGPATCHAHLPDRSAQVGTPSFTVFLSNQSKESVRYAVMQCSTSTVPVGSCTEYVLEHRCINRSQIRSICTGTYSTGTVPVLSTVLVYVPCTSNSKVWELGHTATPNTQYCSGPPVPLLRIRKYTGHSYTRVLYSYWPIQQATVRYS